jgi:hypothetical protein
MSPLEILHGTPTWVWVLLVVLVVRGVKLMKGGTTPLSKLAIMPLVFAGMGILHLIHAPVAIWTGSCAWVVGLLAGIVGGVWLASRGRFTVDPVARTVTSPGSVLPLVLILTIFAAKFWIGFETATAVGLASTAMYTVIGALISGVVAGMFAGRFITYWKAMQIREAMPLRA